MIHTMSNLADRALPEPLSSSVERTQTPTKELSALQKHCAQLYGRGFKRSQIARALVDHLVPDKRRPLEQRLSAARKKLRNWEMTEKFRDYIYHNAIVKADVEMPQVFEGVTRKAKRGNVAAARLMLEVTGRHNPKGEIQPANVTIAINGVPRPEGTVDYSASEDEVQEIEG